MEFKKGRLKTSDGLYIYAGLIFILSSAYHKDTRQGDHRAANQRGGGYRVAASYEEDGKKQNQYNTGKTVYLPAPVEGMILPRRFMAHCLLLFRHCHNAVCAATDNRIVLRQIRRRGQRPRMEALGNHHLHTLVGQDLFDQLRGFDDGLDRLLRRVRRVAGHFRAFCIAR